MSAALANPGLYRGSPRICEAGFCRKKIKQREKNTHTHRCLMCSILDGLVICLWLFFMLHLLLFGHLKFLGTLYWYGSHDVNHHRAGWYCFREPVLTQTGLFPAQSCFASTMCAVLAVSLLLLSTRLLYLQRSRPLFQGMFTVWLRPLHVGAPIEINCLACMIHTGKFSLLKLSY